MASSCVALLRWRALDADPQISFSHRPLLSFVFLQRVFETARDRVWYVHLNCSQPPFSKMRTFFHVSFLQIPPPLPSTSPATTRLQRISGPDHRGWRRLLSGGCLCLAAAPGCRDCSTAANRLCPGRHLKHPHEWHDRHRGSQPAKVGLGDTFVGFNWMAQAVIMALV